MSFDWNDQSIQRAFAYGCFESKQLAKTAVDMIEKHVTVDTLTVYEWYEEFKATEQSSTQRERLVGQKVPEQGTQVVNNAGSILNSAFLADREIKREIEEDSETSQLDAKRSRLDPTTDMGNSSAQVVNYAGSISNSDFLADQEMKREIEEDSETSQPDAKKSRLGSNTDVGYSSSLRHEIGEEVDRPIKVEVYEDCNISEIDIYLHDDAVTIEKTLMDRSRIPPQGFLYKAEDPTQCSFIHRAISEVESIFNTPNLKLDKLQITHNTEENEVTEEKGKTFYEGFQQMMAKLSEKLHLRDFEVFVESPEVLIGFLKAIHPESLT